MYPYSGTPGPADEVAWTGYGPQYGPAYLSMQAAWGGPSPQYVTAISSVQASGMGSSQPVRATPPLLSAPAAATPSNIGIAPSNEASWKAPNLQNSPTFSSGQAFGTGSSQAVPATPQPFRAPAAADFHTVDNAPSNEASREAHNLQYVSAIASEQGSGRGSSHSVAASPHPLPAPTAANTHTVESAPSNEVSSPESVSQPPEKGWKPPRGRPKKETLEAIQAAAAAAGQVYPNPNNKKRTSPPGEGPKNPEAKKAKKSTPEAAKQKGKGKKPKKSAPEAANEELPLRQPEQSIAELSDQDGGFEWSSTTSVEPMGESTALPTKTTKAAVDGSAPSSKPTKALVARPKAILSAPCRCWYANECPHGPKSPSSGPSRTEIDAMFQGGLPTGTYEPLSEIQEDTNYVAEPYDYGNGIDDGWFIKNFELETFHEFFDLEAAAAETPMFS